MKSYNDIVRKMIAQVAKASRWYKEQPMSSDDQLLILNKFEKTQYQTIIFQDCQVMREFAKRVSWIIEEENRKNRAQLQMHGAQGPRDLTEEDFPYIP